MNLVEYPDRELMMFTLADQLASDLGAQLRLNDRASLSVPGGTTPGPVFDVLSGVGLDWDRVTVFPNDERWVPETSERSNGRLLKQRLLTPKIIQVGVATRHHIKQSHIKGSFSQHRPQRGNIRQEC